MDITFSKVRLDYINNKYDFNNQNCYNLNIFGIRSKNKISDTYDDLIGVIYKDEEDKFVIKTWSATCDPGTFYLKNPLNSEGTLIMLPGQYKGVFKLGLHGRSSLSPYKALEQCGDILYIRDNNKDNILNFELALNKKNIIKGNFKTNIHRSSKTVFNKLIGKYSAGCQVFQKSSDFDEFIKLCEKHISNGNGNLFDYTLFS